MALMIILISHVENHTGSKPISKKILIVYFGSLLIGWSCSIFYNHNPKIFVWLSGLTYWCMLMIQVSFFHLVFRITQTNDKELFPRIHYILPIIIAGIQQIWTMLVPYNVTLNIIESRGIPSELYPLYSFYFLFKTKMFMIYGLVYITWAIFRIRSYKKAIVNYSADGEKTSLRWLNILIIMTFILVVLPVSTAFNNTGFLFSTRIILPVNVLLLLFQFALICYNYLTGNYLQIQFDMKEESNVMPPENSPFDKRYLSINKEDFDTFMRNEKPYINPELKVTDLAAHFHTNRSYISSFINETYKMNFSRLINSYRLEEFYQLESENPGTNKNLLAIRAGFGSYRSFIRARQQQK